jgi:ankyrin repeat protein
MVNMFREAEAAILRKDCKNIDVLISEGLDVNSRTDVDRWNLLHIALVPVERPPDPGVIRHLIQMGVDVNARDRRLWTPLHFAVRTKNSEVVRLLLQAGAEIDPVNDEHITPLHLSVMKAQRSLEITRMLLAAGANPDADRGSGTVRHYLSVISSPDIGTFRELVNKYSIK